MASRKSMANMLESVIPSTPNASTPLRRKSIAPTRESLSALFVNDDESERLARRREINVNSSPVSANLNDRRRSLGLGFLAQMPPSQMAERITQCIKLGTENKINLKNAFSLDMIDFMTYMIKKQDANMSNLQVASTSLDVSTKIYGFRVDGVHTEILKMIGGLDKQDKEDVPNNIDGTNEHVVSEEGKPAKKAKTKRRSKQKIFVSVESLRRKVETVRPSLVMMEDSQTTDMLYQAMLPSHAHSRFYLYPHNDVVVDTLEPNVTTDNSTRVSVPKLEDISQMEICPPLFSFDFHNWNTDDEPSILDAGPPEEPSRNEFQFDFDASLPPDDFTPITGKDYFDLENEEENVERCVRVPREVENITDFREVLTTAKPANVSEYTVVQKALHSHWAGPSHWKANNFKKTLSTSKVVETCRQGPNRRKREIEVSYKDEIRTTIIEKFKKRPSVKLQPRTAKLEWSEEALTLPPDKHYNIEWANKLFFHTLQIKGNENKDEECDEHVSDAGQDYDYINENDLSHNPPEVNNDMNNEGHGANEHNIDINRNDKFQDDSEIGSQMPYTGTNLVAAPTLTCKSMIAYSTRAKKIDMRQLKKSIWKCLISSNDKENTNLHISLSQDKEDKMINNNRFSEIYKKLPTMLTKTNAEALSFPISFVSLLHLANEKSLKISSSLDLADVIVQED